MNQIKSLSGRTYILDRTHPVGKGGEAQLFNVSNYSGAVAKLYTPNLCNSHRERKLMAMLQIPLSDELETELAWPKDILYDNNEQLIGFVMRKVSGGIPLNVIFSDESNCDLLKRIIVAKNLCVTINNIHKAGLVIGDLNPKNILVLETGLVRIIDTDSFHITDNQGRTFRCEVCVPEYISPKISTVISKGETLKTTPLPTYTQESDEYSLAILIFQLLLHGVHPFSVALAKGNDLDTPQPADLMKRYNFPYDKCPYGMKLPVYALPFKILSERLRFMFIKSFSKGESISAEIWYDALCDFEKEISRTCKANHNHKYRKGLRKCPYCDALKRKELFFKNQKKKH